MLRCCTLVLHRQSELCITVLETAAAAAAETTLPRFPESWPAATTAAQRDTEGGQLSGWCCVGILPLHEAGRAGICAREVDGRGLQWRRHERACYKLSCEQLTRLEHGSKLVSTVFFHALLRFFFYSTQCHSLGLLWRAECQPSSRDTPKKAGDTWWNTAQPVGHWLWNAAVYSIIV